MLRALLRTLPVEFDVISSTESLRFKPHASIYHRTLERLGVGAGELLHVAGSHTDSMGATAAGITTIWVNRANDAVIDHRFAPAHQVADLRGVLPILDAG
jgi:2-haloacid dehalogenase